MGYFVQAAARLTEEERADLSAIVNKPDLDVEVFSELISRADVAVNINELIHWSIEKRLACHKVGVPEPPFTADDFLAIVNEKTEEAKRQKFAQLLARRIMEMGGEANTLTINADDLPGARSILEVLIKKNKAISVNNKLVSLLEEREKLIEQKKKALKGFRDAIESIDAAISDEVKDIKSGQGRLFDDVSTPAKESNGGEVR